MLIYSLDAFKRVIGGGIALKCYTEATQRFQIVLTLALQRASFLVDST